jgi:hypothetical protein
VGYPRFIPSRLRIGISTFRTPQYDTQEISEQQRWFDSAGGKTLHASWLKVKTVKSGVGSREHSR